MNRQVRRAEEKKERKQEKDKAKAKAARRARRRKRVAQRKRPSPAERKETGAKDEGEEAPAGIKEARGGRRRGSDPGRFSGALMIATLFFIVLQAVTPSDGTIATQAVAASFYLLFGYFAVLWLLRRGIGRAIPFALAVGALLWAGTALSTWLQPQLEFAPLMIGLIPPLLIAGAFLGRLVYRNAPA